MSTITYIDEADIHDKKVLLRDDLNVSLTDSFTIADDARIIQSLPTIKYLLQKNNKLIIISHLGRPKGKDAKFSLQIVVDKLQGYLPEYKVKLAPELDFPDLANQQPNEVIVLENIRFYEEEKANDPQFAKRLASLGDVYVNDAFGVCHRTDASVVGIPQYLPSYGGLLLKKEIQMISSAVENPKKPVVAIIGGAKIETKINFIGKLTELADEVIIGGALANTFLCAKGINIGKSYCEYEKVNQAKELLKLAEEKNTHIVLPVDGAVATDSNDNVSEIKKINEIPQGGYILDIGPETQAVFGAIIAKARTIIWNGPVGYTENPNFRRGTDFIYYAITQNTDAISIVGGGDTLAVISKKEYLEKITHVSTGGGAMLEFIEKGTLPGIEALKK